MDDLSWGSVKKCIKGYKTARFMDKQFNNKVKKLHQIRGEGEREM